MIFQRIDNLFGSESEYHNRLEIYQSQNSKNITYLHMYSITHITANLCNYA